jgi:AAA domain
MIPPEGLPEGLEQDIMNLKHLLTTLAGKDASIAELIRQGVRAPEMLPGNHLYAGAVHSLAGAPESGKSTFGVFFCNRVIEANQHAMFLDYENRAESFADRAAALGMRADKAAKYLHYYDCGQRVWDDADVDWLHRQVRRYRPSLIVMDSLVDFLSSAGISEQSADGVIRFMGRVVAPMASKYGSACLIIDHLAKNSKTDDAHARGTSAKLGFYDVALRLERDGEGFDRTRGARVNLLIRKDRRGHLRQAGFHEHWQIDVEAGRISLTPITEGT